jgi:hypothetical protein
MEYDYQPTPDEAAKIQAELKRRKAPALATA